MTARTRARGWRRLTPHLWRYARHRIGAVTGTSDEVLRGRAEVIEAGAQMIALTPVGENVAEDREQMERLAAYVISRLR